MQFRRFGPRGACDIGFELLLRHKDYAHVYPGSFSTPASLVALHSLNDD